MNLEAQALKLQYGETVIAAAMDFSVREPQIVSIIGPNGSGKSTLLKALGRILKPSGGAVLLEGKDLHAMKPWEVAKKLAILPQSALAPGDMTVADLVAYGRMPHQRLLARSSDADAREIAEALRATGMERLADRRLDRLSGGERQRAWIALALAQQPEILLLDEPTTYLDIRYQLELMQLVARLHRERGITVIMVLHDLNHAARFSDRLVAVRQGQIVADGAVAEVFTEETLERLYDVETTVLRLEEGGAAHLVYFPRDVRLPQPA